MTKEFKIILSAWFVNLILFTVSLFLSNYHYYTYEEHNKKETNNER